MVCCDKRNSGCVHGGKQCCGSYGGGALDVVVEGAEAITIALQQPRRIGSCKVFPLQQNVRPAFLHRGHERFDEVVIFLPAHAIVLPADVDRIIEKLFVVSSRIEQNGQAMLRRNAAQRGVERHFADGNSHAACALVAEAENALAIADHDAAHIVVTLISKYLVDAMPIRIADEQAARPPPDLRETLAALAHRRGVDNGQKLVGVVLDHRVEQRLVVVLQIAHVAVFAESRVTRIEHPLAAHALILQRADVGRKQSVQPKHIALVLGKCRALVEARIKQQIDAMETRAKNGALSIWLAIGLIGGDWGRFAHGKLSFRLESSNPAPFKTHR